MANIKEFFWSGVCGAIVIYPALVAGAVHGTYNVLTDKGDFEEGFNVTMGNIYDTAVDFGEEHAEKFSSFARDVAVGVVAAAIGAKVFKK